MRFFCPICSSQDLVVTSDTIEKLLDHMEKEHHVKLEKNTHMVTEVEIP